MSNSIHAPRNNPRVDSVNFRSLWWVVRREAVLAVITDRLTPAATVELWRLKLASFRTFKVIALYERVVLAWPARRFRP